MSWECRMVKALCRVRSVMSHATIDSLLRASVRLVSDSWSSLSGMTQVTDISLSTSTPDFSTRLPCA